MRTSVLDLGETIVHIISLHLKQIFTPNESSVENKRNINIV